MLKSLTKIRSNSVRNAFKKVVDGNAATAHVAYALSENSFIYPITPSSQMAEHMDAFMTDGRENVFGGTVNVVEMQSEGGAAGAIHGSLAAGGLTSTFTSSQGLLLMLPNMYKIAGELMPAVFHVAARSLATHALSIFGDHQDVMAARACGFCFLSSASVQECHDLALVAHLSALKLSLPFCHFFDGFRTSNELHKIEMLDYDEIAELVNMDNIYKFKETALNPEKPHFRGSSQAPDIYFQQVESANPYYDAVTPVVCGMMRKVGKVTGREIRPFDYFGHPEATRVIVLLGSGSEVVHEVVEFINKERGQKVGVIKVRLFRPWSVDEFEKILPRSVTSMAVLDRTKEHGSWAEPLYLEVAATLKDRRPDITLVGGRYGLGSKDFKPTHVMSVYENLKFSAPKNNFTVGIHDDISDMSLPPRMKKLTTTPQGTVCCLFWGIGGDGTVGANHKAIEIIGDNTELHAQGFFEYDAKKAGGMTRSNLRFGESAIHSTYTITNADYIACHVPYYVNRFDLLKRARENSVFVLNSPWDSTEKMAEKLPGELKRKIAVLNIRVYNVDAHKIASEIGLGERVNMIMQTVFFSLADVLPFDEAIELLKQSIVEDFQRKGDEVVNMNLDAVDQTLEMIKEIKYDREEWLNSPLDEEKKDYKSNFERIVDKCGRWKGNRLKVSVFQAGGRFPTGTSKLEKRGLAIEVPVWNDETCIQCNSCSFVCPHAVLRPFLFTEEELKDAPEGFVTIPSSEKKLVDQQYQYRIQPSSLDCTSCANCVEACPTDPKSLEMKPFMDVKEKFEKYWEFCVSVPHKDVSALNPLQPKNLAYRYPYLEFHGGCAGCGETTYVKILTQLYGDHMVIANATGCSSIWGGSAPTCPYTTDERGYGPAWGNSLFEDNAEYGFGITSATNHERDYLRKKAEIAIGKVDNAELKNAISEWLDNFDDVEGSRAAGEKLKKLLEENESLEEIPEVKEMKERSNLFTKFSFWLVGGDGWAYDIGLGGLLHTMAMKTNINTLVLDTEIYSNTGGQASKATQMGAVAKFATGGKDFKKMDLGRMVMSMGNAYVASCSLGANRNHYLKVLKEASEFCGPSLVLCYCPCIGHGYSSMRHTQHEEEMAVKTGYWPLYRYNPQLEEKRFSLDFKKVDFDLLDEFMDKEVRHRSLQVQFPDRFTELRAQLKEDLKHRYEHLEKMEEWK